MATKDISDIEVLKAYKIARSLGIPCETVLFKLTGQPEKVCYRAMQRCDKRRLVDYGVSLRFAFLTEKGEKLLREKL